MINHSPDWMHYLHNVQLWLWDHLTTNEANWPLSGQFDFIKEVVSRSVWQNNTPFIAKHQQLNYIFI